MRPQALTALWNRALRQAFPHLMCPCCQINFREALDSITNGEFRHLDAVCSNDPSIRTTRWSTRVNENRRFVIERAHQRKATRKPCSHHLPTEQDLARIG